MLSLLVQLIVQTPGKSQDFLGLFEQRIKSFQSIDLEFESKTEQWPQGAQLRLRLQLPMSQLFEARSPGMSYRLAQSEGRILELDSNLRKYDRFHGALSLIDPSPEISVIAWKSYPAFFRPGYLSTVLRQADKETVGVFDPPGQKSVMSYTASDGDSDRIKVWLDSSGTVRRIRQDYQTQMGPGYLDLLVKKWTWNPTLSPSIFSTRLPLGYSPISLEDNRVPLTISSPIPEGPWLEAFTNRLVKGPALVESGPLLLVVTSPGCPASARLIPFMKSLQEFMKARKGKLIELSDQHDQQGLKDNGWPLYSDAQGTLDKALSVPGTPMFYLFDSAGKVAGLWFGDNPDKRDVLKSEIDFMIKNPPLDAME